MKCLVYILVLAWVQLSPVLAQSSAADQSAQLGYSQRLYDNGHYLSAANAARELGTASAHAFAARSVLSHVVSRDLDASAALFIAEGEADARYALVLDPDCVEARVQLAVALGLKARLIGHVRAHFNGLATESKAHLDAALARAPDDVWVLSVLGGWHLEIVRVAGPDLAKLLYGASQSAGIGFFEQALAAEPDNLIIRQQYGLLLGATSDPGFRRRAEEVLVAATSLSPRSHFEKDAHKRAGELLDALRQGDPARLAEVVKSQIEPC